MSRVKLNLIAAACDNMGIGVNGTLPWRLKKEMSYFTSMTTTVTDLTKMNAVIMGRVTWDCIPLKYKPLEGRLNVVLTRNTTKVKENVPEGVIVLESMDEAVKYIEGRSDIESTWVIGGSAIYKVPEGVIVLESMDEAVKYIEGRSDIESTWVIGGSAIYKVPEGVIVLESMDEAVKYIEGRSDIESTWVIGGSAIYKAAMDHPNCGKVYLTEIQKSFECDTFFPAIDTNKFQLTTEDTVPQKLQTEGDISYYFRIYQKL